MDTILGGYQHSPEKRTGFADFGLKPWMFPRIEKYQLQERVLAPLPPDENWAGSAWYPHASTEIDPKTIY
jgi:hypothetical protein